MVSAIIQANQNFSVALDSRREKFEALLPPWIAFDRFKATLTTAVARDPKLLMDCSADSLILSGILAAEDGLLPDGRECALIPFGGRATYVQMVAGLRKLAWGSSLQALVQSHLVYEGDSFELVRGTQPAINHVSSLIALDQGPEAVIGAYAIATMSDGRQLFEVMGRAEIARFRSMSKAKRSDSPWAVWTEQMMRVRPVKRLCKALPLQSNNEADRRLILAANRFDPEIEGVIEPDAPAIADASGSSSVAPLEQALGLEGPTPEVHTQPPVSQSVPQAASTVEAVSPQPETPPAPAKRRPGRPRKADQQRPLPPPREAVAPPAAAPAPEQRDTPQEALQREAQELYEGGMELLDECHDYRAACLLETDMQQTLARLGEIAPEAGMRLKAALAGRVRELAPQDEPSSDPSVSDEELPPPPEMGRKEAQAIADFVVSKLVRHETLRPDEVVDKLRAAPKNAANFPRMKHWHPEIFRMMDDALESHAMGL